jgi:hypothetical protein
MTITRSAASIAALSVLLLGCLRAHAQTVYVADQAGTIGEYNGSTGAPINASLVSGLNNPTALALSGRDLYVVNNGAGTIGEYDATTGAPINTFLPSGLIGPTITGIAVSGGNLYVASESGPFGQVGEYYASTGAVVNATLITGLFHIEGGMAVSGGSLYVGSNYGGGIVGEYQLDGTPTELLPAEAGRWAEKS